MSTTTTVDPATGREPATYDAVGWSGVDPDGRYDAPTDVRTVYVGDQTVLEVAAAVSEASFDHVGLAVGDLPAMTAWYAAALGLAVEFEFALDHVAFSGVMLRSPAGYRLELLHRPGSGPGLQAASPVEAALTRGFGHLALDVPDVDASYQTLLAAGATDRMSPRPSPEPGVRMAYVADPEGNLLELLDRTASRARGQAASTGGVAARPARPDPVGVGPTTARSMPAIDSPEFPPPYERPSLETRHDTEGPRP